MGKVDWITWKTDADEILNPSIIKEKITDAYINYNTYMNPVVYEQLKYEIIKGGLSKEQFNISGISPAYEMTKEILNHLDEIKITITNLKESIDKVAIEQKEIEKKQLINVINEKIRQEEEQLQHILLAINHDEIDDSSTSNMSNEICIINDRIQRLKAKLEQVNAL